MTIPNALIAGIALLGLVGAIGWWLIFTTEGVYLGQRVVVWLYDVYARRYDRIKRFHPGWEQDMLTRPILNRLIQVPSPLILDVATGTARLPVALFAEPGFRGHIVGLDYSRRMLAVAAEKTAAHADQLDLIYQSAMNLPFDDETFDAVICLEALEFMPDANTVLAEMVRVARSGALFLLTNRKGFGARLMPGKTCPRESMLSLLQNRFGLEDVSAQIWQVDYEQIWAFKPGWLEAAPDHRLEAILRCPCCGQRTLCLEETRTPDQTYTICRTCKVRVPRGVDRVIEYASALRRTGWSRRG